MQNNDSKIIWADHLRAFATFSVILIHVAAPGIYQYGKVSNYDWCVSNVFDGFSRFCVPIFLMLTGALLLPKADRLTDFLKKRFSRILFPFLFWSCIYILYDLISIGYRGENWNVSEKSSFVLKQFQYGASYHLWYVYLLIGIYLFLPIISQWIRNSTQNEIAYYILLWLVVIALNLPLINKFKPNVNLTYFSGFLGYPILGYWLNIKFTNRKIKWAALALFLIGIAITISGTYWMTANKNHFFSGFYSYLSPNVILTSIGVFLIFKHSSFSNKWIAILSTSISKYSYGIYLSHVFVLMVLSKLGISGLFINPILGIPLTTVLCLMISLLITYSINKIPYGRIVSG
ncbi:acyltransferase family protein [Flavobacterium sp.]|uniref:acyltransferase n=1 Tax=Flavobacterium sp. TaxID=239 RepID=UPI00286C9282|nr:acyltransferase family protein [Flavobacterium sp.]